MVHTTSDNKTTGFGRARTTTKTTRIFSKWDGDKWVEFEKEEQTIEHDVPAPPIMSQRWQFPPPAAPRPVSPFGPPYAPPYYVGDVPPFSGMGIADVQSASSVQPMTDPYRGTDRPEWGTQL